MGRKISLLGVFPVALIVAEASVYAAPSSSARSLGMAGAYTAVARGVEAPLWNPANLGLPGRSCSAFRLPSVGVDVHNNSFSLGQYNTYFTTGDYLDSQAKNDLLGSVPADGARIDADANADVLAFSTGKMAFTTYGWAPGYVSLAKDWFDLFLNGNRLGRVYNLDADGEGFAVAGAALSVARRLSLGRFKDSAVGLSLKYLRGLYYAGVVQSDLSFAAWLTGLQSTGTMISRLAQGGSGLAFDLGFASALNDRYSVGISLVNLGSGIRWTREPEEHEFRINADSLMILDNPDSLSEVVDAALWDTTRDLSSFTSKYPTFLRAGVCRETDKLLLSLDYEQGFSTGPGVSTRPRLSLGLEYRPLRFLPLRTGLSLGGLRGFFLGSGFGLDFSGYALDVALANDGITSSSAQGLALALTQTLYFGKPPELPAHVPKVGVGTIVGMITDSKTGMPVSASVTALDSTRIPVAHGVSDSATGQFVLAVPVVGKGNVSLSAGKDGYLPQERTIPVAGKETTSVDVSMVRIEPPKGVLAGAVKDGETGVPRAARIALSGTGLPEFSTDSTSGIFLEELSPGSYNVSVAAAGFDSIRERPFTIQDKETTSLVLALNPTIKTGTKWVFRNIMFDPQEPLIEPTSYPVLDEVTKTLRNNPRTKIEIGVHSDSKGTNAKNLKVTQTHAEAIRTFLIKSGIAADRIVSKGYGEEKPLVSNKTKEGRAQNRRVEILVVGR